MTRDNIIRMAREAGFICLFPDEAVNGIGTIYNYNSGDEEITEMMERFAALVAAHEREILRRDGWRKCAAGQRTTQFCAMVEEAVKAEREACAKICEETTASWSQYDYNSGCVDCAKAIRARGEEPKRHPGYIIGDHWLQAAYTRVCTGETEDEVMTDYGWQRARGEK